MNTNTAHPRMPQPVDGDLLVVTQRSHAGYMLDSLLTLGGWLLFFFLFAAGIVAILRGEMRGPDSPLLPQIMLASVITIVGYIITMAINSLILIGWAKYNQYRFSGKDRRKPPLPLTAERLCTSFAIPPTLLERARMTRVMVIQHDEDGAILDIQNAALQPAAAAPAPVATAPTPVPVAPATTTTWGMRWSTSLPAMAMGALATAPAHLSTFQHRSTRTDARNPPPSHGQPTFA